eukprot:1146217-Pelagomonas_calceolata.AAC.1
MPRPGPSRFMHRAGKSIKPQLSPPFFSLFALNVSALLMLVHSHAGWRLRGARSRICKEL